MKHDDLPKTEKGWEAQLSKEEYHVLRKKGTEAPFTGEYWNHFDLGVYNCRGCGESLFTSEDKFDAGCGWPSFSNEVGQEKVKKKQDITHGMVRTEILCARCEGHLGHVFNDGPDPTGLRYCVNSASIKFKAN